MRDEKNNGLLLRNIRELAALRPETAALNLFKRVYLQNGFCPVLLVFQDDFSLVNHEHEVDGLANSNHFPERVQVKLS